jgi:hypothetical protein
LVHVERIGEEAEDTLMKTAALAPKPSKRPAATKARYQVNLGCC